jgi:hypothetical protein
MNIQRNKPFESVLLKISWPSFNCLKLSNRRRGYRRLHRLIKIVYRETELYWKKSRVAYQENEYCV